MNDSWERRDQMTSNYRYLEKTSGVVIWRIFSFEKCKHIHSILVLLASQLSPMRNGIPQVGEHWKSSNLKWRVNFEKELLNWSSQQHVLAVKDACTLQKTWIRASISNNEGWQKQLVIVNPNICGLLWMDCSAFFHNEQRKLWLAPYDWQMITWLICNLPNKVFI